VESAHDPLNFWALSTPVLKKNLELIAFADVLEAKKIALPMLPEYMTRIMVVARNPPFRSQWADIHHCHLLMVK
jgi:hypothetical protein